MGSKSVSDATDPARVRAYTDRLLREQAALEALLASGRVETGARRMGAEQEMFLVDASGRPAWVGPDVLKHLPSSRYTSEIGVFNLEANLAPQPVGPELLRVLHADLREAVGDADRAARALGARVALVGILPTLTTSDLELGCIAPEDRYLMLDHALVAARGGPFRVHVRGRDVLDLEQDNVMLESANTSYQLHLQVDPDAFAPLYNLAQLISAPQVAAAANAPTLLGRRLWQETRIALFEGAVDERTDAERARGKPARVGFGSGWVRGGFAELFRDNLARYRPLLTTDDEDDALATVRAGGVPTLRALMLHNGTIWRWNRACYGVVDGVAHVRIENRVLPSGPTPVDAVANAALFYGLMLELEDVAPSIPARLAFDDARANLVEAARDGLDATFTWLDGERVGARALLLDRLIPAARAGLASLEVPPEDVDRYLGVLEARVATGRTGARWILDSLAHLRRRGRRDAEHLVVEQLVAGLEADAPVHTWPLPDAEAGSLPQTAGEILTRDLVTARPDDLVDLVAHVMRWQRVRHVPVEDAHGRALGVLTHRALLAAAPGATVADVMVRSPSHVRPDTPLDAATRALLAAPEGCLLVVDEGRLVGLLTPRDVLRVHSDAFRARG